MDRLTETMLGESALEDDAVDQGSTAAEDEGAFDPLAVLDDLDTPEDEASDDADDESDEDESTEEPVDAVAALTEREEKLAEREAEIAAKADEAERKDQLRLMKEADAAWKAEESQAYDWAVNTAKQNPKQAIDGIRQYYTGKIDQILKSSETLIKQAYSGQFIDQVAKQTGLTEDDTALLAAIDPKSVPAVAKALAAKNKAVDARFAALEDQTKNLARGRQANRRTMTGADRPAPSRGNGAPVQRIQYGTADNVEFLMRARDALAGKT